MSLGSNLMNCTPHAVVVYSEDKLPIVEYPPSGIIARLNQEPQVKVGEIITQSGKCIPVYSTQKFGDVTDLPAISPDCPDIIVSMLVGQVLEKTQAYPGAVYGPDTGLGAVRSPSGQIIGTTRLIQYCARKVFETP